MINDCLKPLRSGLCVGASLLDTLTHHPTCPANGLTIKTYNPPRPLLSLCPKSSKENTEAPMKTNRRAPRFVYDVI